MNEFRMIQRAHLVPPSEPMRVEMDDERLADLRKSIRDVGVLQALLVFPVDDKYEIIDGHRRYVATEDLPEEFLPCRVFDSSEEARYAMMLDATMCHEDFTPAEEGQQFIELSEKHGWSLDDLCAKFRKSENYINSRVILVTKDQRIGAAVNARKINMAQAHELLHEKDEERRGVRLLLAIEHGYNARELRVMRQNLEAERQVNAGEPHPNTPTWATAAPAPEQLACAWCGRTDDVANMSTIPVHGYHKPEVLAVLDQVGIKNLLAPKPAQVT